MPDQNQPTLSRKLTSEFLGTAFLVAAVVGSGIMGERLADGNDAIALLGNTLSTGAALVVLITIFGPVSGAHFNPIVSLAFAWFRQLSWREFAAYIPAQVLGGIAGTILAHVMFDLPFISASSHIRTGTGIWVSEIVASLGLLVTIFGCHRSRPDMVPYAVGLFITAAYWFTASTSFANPAVTIARAFTGTFSGIRMEDAGWFFLAQIAGTIIAVIFIKWFKFTSRSPA